LRRGASLIALEHIDAAVAGEPRGPLIQSILFS